MDYNLLVYKFTLELYGIYKFMDYTRSNKIRVPYVGYKIYQVEDLPIVSTVKETTFFISSGQQINEV